MSIEAAVKIESRFAELMEIHLMKHACLRSDVNYMEG